MNERKRFRPDENANKFEEVKGGLNKMTQMDKVAAEEASPGAHIGAGTSI